MKKAVKILCSAVAALLVLVIIGGLVTYGVRGSLKKVELSQEFQAGIAAADGSRAEGSDARVMSSNLLVHYASWGGEPAKPRAKMFIEILDAYRPDVVGLQEVSDEWFCCLNRNLPDGYKFLYPLTTGLFVNMTAMIYDSNAVKVIDKGTLKYEEGDNPRLRRVVWGLFENNETGKRFIVTSTHLNLIREGKEAAEFATMTAQANELFELVNKLESQYGCPIFSTGDFNAMEDGSLNGQYDAPAIYALLTAEMTDTKDVAANQYCGDAQGLETPTYDHIFLKGTADVKAYRILSDAYITPLSDHYPIYIDVAI